MEDEGKEERPTVNSPRLELTKKEALALTLERKYGDIIRDSHSGSSSAVFRARIPGDDNGRAPSSNRSRILRSHYQKHLNDVTSMLQAVEVKKGGRTDGQSRSASAEGFSVLGGLQQLNFFSYFLPTTTGANSPEEFPPTGDLYASPAAHVPPSSGRKASLPGRIPSPSPSPSSNDDTSWMPKFSHAPRMSPSERRERFLSAHSLVDNTIANKTVDWPSSSSSNGSGNYCSDVVEGESGSVEATKRGGSSGKSVTINLTPMKSVQDGGGFVGEPYTIAPGLPLSLGDILGLSDRRDDDSGDDDDDTKVGG